MSLLLGVLLLSIAVAVGGLAAFSGEVGRRAMPVLRTFAVVAAASVALIHLLPEALADLGLVALAVTAVAALGPALVERILRPNHDHAHDAPTTALAMGYAAVIAHQAGEGAALATLAQTGALSVSVIAAVAAHTVPLAMVVAIRVLETSRRSKTSGGGRAMLAALGGVAAATGLGAFAGSLLGATRLEAVEPWVLAAAAGLLLHALAHAAFERTTTGTMGRMRDAAAGASGIAVAAVGMDSGAWSASGLPSTFRLVGLAVVVCGVVARAVWPARPHVHAEHASDTATDELAPAERTGRRPPA